MNTSTLTIHVTDDVELNGLTWKAGTVLTTPAEITAYYRAAYAEYHGEPTKLSDEKVLSYVRGVPSAGNPGDEEIARLDAMETDKSEPVAPAMDIRTAHELRRAAHKAGGDIGGLFDAHAEELALAGETVQAAPLVIEADIRAKYPKAEMIGHWPVAKTKAEDVKGTNQWPDIYKTSVMRDGQSVEEQSSFYKEWVEATPWGAEQCTLRDVANAAKKAPEGTSLPPHLKGMTPTEIRAEEERIKGRLRKVQNAVGRAVAIYRQKELWTGLTGVSYYFIKGSNDPKTGKPMMSKSPTPVIIGDLVADDAGNKIAKRSKCISVGTFLAFDVAAAIEAGGSWDALLATNTKGEEGEAELETKEVVVTVGMDRKTEESVFGLLAHRYDPETDDGRANLLALMTAARKNKALRTSWGMLIEGFDTQWKEIAPVYLAEQRAEEQKRLAEKQAAA